jgi:hypothetical protein
VWLFRRAANPPYYGARPASRVAKSAIVRW